MDCMHCKSDISDPAQARTCCVCEAVTCSEPECGTTTVPAITQQPKAWICQQCIAKGFSNMLKASRADSN